MKLIIIILRTSFIIMLMYKYFQMTLIVVIKLVKKDHTIK
jgi:hypothetical protein